MQDQIRKRATFSEFFPLASPSDLFPCNDSQFFPRAMQSANNGWQIVNRKKSSNQKNKSKQPTNPPKQKFEEPTTLSSSKGKRCDY